MSETLWKRISDVASEMQCSRETVRRAALSGRIPSFQPFGEGTAWLIHPQYQKFLAKSVTSEGTNGNQG